jgi:hypothetical protein
MKGMMGGGFLSAVRRTILPEWLSMNCVMAGMIPTMIGLGSLVPGSERASAPGF